MLGNAAHLTTGSQLLTSTLYHGVVLARAQMLLTSCCQFRLP